MTTASTAPLDPLQPCPTCGAHPTGANWSDGSESITLSHEPSCPHEDSQVDSDDWWYGY